MLNLNRAERQIILDALSRLPIEDTARSKRIKRVVRKLTYAEEQPRITVGVYGGQVQWVLGNPFPVRICDYDGERADLPDLDDRGEQCRIWIEPADNAAQS